MRSFVVAFLFLMSGGVSAEIAVLGNLPRELCTDDNQTILRLKEKDTSKCILSLKASEERSVESSDNKTEAKIHLNSSANTIYQASTKTELPLVKVQNKSSIGTRESYVFFTKDKSVEVRLTAKVTGTSCTDDNDGSCCGDSYSGTLTVKTQRGSVKVPIYYYRGG